MIPMRPTPQCENAAHDRLIERIASRYEQLNDALDQVEARLSAIELHAPSDTAVPRTATPRKPR